MMFDNNFCWPYDGIDLVLFWIILEIALNTISASYVDEDKI